MPLRGLEAGGHPLLSTERGVPHISLPFREMWDTTALHVPLSTVGKKVEVRGIPHLAKNERDTPNFLYAALDTTACAPFLKERRIEFDGTRLAPQEIGDMGHPALRGREKDRMGYP
jgi:hypothetical protein